MTTRRRRGRLALVVLSAVALAAGCSSSNSPATLAPGITAGGPTVTAGSGTVQTVSNPATPGPVEAKAKWTVMVYVDADNNIEADLLQDVQRMATVGSNANLNIIVLLDRSPDDTSYSPSPGVNIPDGDILGVPNFNDAKLLRINKGSAQVLQDVGEVSMADPQTLAWFTYTAMTEFPADHYALILNDHGGATLSMQDDSDPPGADGYPPLLTLDKVSGALKTVLQQTGVPRLDFFGYDACLMSNYDSIAQIAPYAKWYVAAEEETIGPQWDMKPMLEAVAGSGPSTGEDMGKAIVDNVVSSVPDYGNATMSLIDEDKVAPLTQALTSFAQALTANMPTIATTLGRARADSLQFGVDPSGKGLPFDMLDLTDLTSRLQGAPAAVVTAGNAVAAAIKAAVDDKAQGKAEQQAAGISMYFPASPDDYSSLLGQLYQNQPSAGAWNQMLKAYFSAAGNSSTASGAAPQFTSQNATLQLQQGGVLVSAQLAGGTESSVVEAQLFAGRPDSDGVSFDILVVEPAEIGAGSAQTIAAGWDFSALQVGDGTTNLDASVILEPVSGALKGRIPMLYQGPDGSQAQAVIEFTLDSSGNVSGAQLLQFGSDGTVSQLAPAQGSLLAPEVLVVGPNGNIQPQLLSNQALDATGDISFGATQLAHGSTFIVALLAANAAGDTASAFGTGTVP